MTDGIEAALDNEVSLLVGTARRPLRAAPGVPDPTDPNAALAALAVASAARLHGRRTDLAPLDGVAKAVGSSGRPVTGALREAILEAFGPLASDATCRRTLARRLSAAGLEINPLDLVPLRKLACEERESFGGRTLAFADRMDPREAAAADPRDWPQWKPTEIRSLFFRLRGEDADAARGLAAAGMEFATRDGKAAALRGFTGNLSLGLTEEDAALAWPHAVSKSANRLRQAAFGLLSAVPGTEAHATASRTLLDGLKLWNRRSHEPRWMREPADADDLFGGPIGIFLRVPVDDVVARIGTTRDRVHEIELSEDLARGLLLRAEVEGDFDLMRRLASLMRPEALDPRRDGDEAGQLEPMPSTRRNGRVADFLEAVAPAFVGPDAQYPASLRPLLDLHADANLPLSAASADALLASNAWREVKRGARSPWDRTDDVAAAVAGLVPPGSRGKVRLSLLSAYPDPSSLPSLALRVHELIDRETAR